MVQGWPVPDSVSAVRSFLGMCNYFRRFIQGYAKLCTPLSSLLKKDVPFAWSAACAEAFQGLKYALTHAPVLVVPDFSTDAPTFEVWCDASGFAVGAVLMQGGRPVAFEARTMTPAERNYTVGEHELLAVVYALTKWRCYLEGVTFRVMTDHAPNTFMPTKAQLSRRQA